MTRTATIIIPLHHYHTVTKSRSPEAPLRRNRHRPAEQRLTFPPSPFIEPLYSPSSEATAGTRWVRDHQGRWWPVATAWSTRVELRSLPGWIGEEWALPLQDA
ncbi:uncharacterized protein BO72DRAFT_446230 [Aspergillus fijiensis CBS 313.89]|uniref:Uncharacterized protein n=1 Tax=Aspergillus fijiensis CBS 313.89 TaxID=1448319 RepID=A0A8G1RSJ2_9EURO|nr:uncharacterized protein BO72DRAFT_446230 [Aspergillus fijiensis CBS 313.89]RAK79417.1 hypothetical protein BO72DRAFT_446230 [Aspergillus fijiensis CBS 313.89]